MESIRKTVRWMFEQAKSFFAPITVIIVSGALLSLLEVSLAWISKFLVDAAADRLWMKGVWAGIAFIFVILIQIGLTAYISTMSYRTSELMINQMQKKLLSHLSNIEWLEFTKYHSGDILTRITSDMSIVVEVWVNIIPEVVSLGVSITAAFITLMIFDPTLAILAFLLGPTAVVTSRILGRKWKPIHKKAQEAESSFRSYIQEYIQNMLIIKTFCYEEESKRRIEKLQKNKLTWGLRRNHMGVVTSSVLSAGYWLGYFLSFCWGSLRLVQGKATFGTLTAFLQLVERVQAPFVGLAYTMPRFIALTASAERLMELEVLHTEARQGELSGLTAAGITFDQVSYGYEPGFQILKNISIEILPGEIIGIIGPSGEGKTTIIKLILSLLQPDTGKITFNNTTGRAVELNAASRALISYVPQGNTLFSGTILENLQMGVNRESEKEFTEALKGADIWDYIESLPEGLRTVIGEHGLGLSEGQAQRIAIARALIRKAPILILDEATSALDQETEKKIIHTIAELSPRRTCIIISHRTSLLRICDRVLQLNDGYLQDIHETNGAVPANAAV